ncbi:MAG: GNAT family N-acetyltransferase [Ferruginibacter sp.]
MDFGSYYGIFEKEKLVAMTGQRLHLPRHSEISAVCTHPDHLGKGYAGILLDHQIDIILSEAYIPFLHVRSDNHRAVGVSERLGFQANGVMNFYFLRRI